MKRDVLELSWNSEETLIIASDNSGALGEKQADAVRVPYEVVGYYSFRVAVMECMAARATPEAIVIHNFNGDPAWEKLCMGIKKGLNELSMTDLPITGSTESNFSLHNSATGIIVVGKKRIRKEKEQVRKTSHPTNIAVIGKPLVGQAVLDYPDEMAPLSVFRWCLEQPEIEIILPVGSKGILYEWNQMEHRESPLTIEQVSGSVDFQASAGPATCFLIRYEQKAEQALRDKIGKWFHRIHAE